MRIVLDNEPIAAASGDPGTPASIADALALARRTAEARGRVVVEALLDGEPLTDAQLNSPPTAPRSSGEMRFSTAEPAELVGSTLRGVADTLADVKSDQLAAAELITVGNMSEAMDRLHQALRAWDGVRAAVLDSATLLNISVESCRVATPGGERLMADQVRLLAESLAEVKRAFNAQDWSGLADALGYDMQERADQWRETLVGLADMVRASTRAETRGAPAQESDNAA